MTRIIDFQIYKREKAKEGERIMEAIDLLKANNMENDLPISLSKLLENIDIKAYKDDFSEIDGGDEIAGFIKKDHNDTIILVNIDDIYTRQRFTIAHEIAHYFLHMKDSAIAKHIELRSNDYTSPKEIEANKFAAELLMPEHLVRKQYEKETFVFASDLADTFEVSLSAMKIRLNSLNLWYYD